MSKTALQATWDVVGIPFRFFLFDQKWLPTFRWTTLEEERITAVLPRVKGRLLDIGAGTNTLVKRWGNGVGVDVHDWGNDVIVVEDSSALPFEDASFDTVSFIACLNHIPYRERALKEAGRLLRRDGRILVTMINPILGGVGHAIWWHAEDRHRGGMKEGEVGGMWSRDIIRVCEKAGFAPTCHGRFVYGLNHLYQFERRSASPGGESMTEPEVRPAAATSCAGPESSVER